MEGSGSSYTRSSSGSIISEVRNVRMENPFTLKVGQVFTGFGIGCGVGIGVGRPLNLGVIPMLNQIMSAARGATDAFSGVGRHVNDTLRKLGVRNIEAGIGCGVGLGHGFGIGLSLKPRVVHQIQSHVLRAMESMMMKLGVAPGFSVGEGVVVPPSLQGSTRNLNQPSFQNPVEKFTYLATEVPENVSKGIRDSGTNDVSSQDTLASQSSQLMTSYGSQTEKVLSNFLQNPLLKEEETGVNEPAELLRAENSILKLVLKHQQVIEELRQENEKLRHILIEDLKIPPSKFQEKYSNRSKSSCNECFDCRRKQRKR